MREPLGLILAGARGTHIGGDPTSGVMLCGQTLLARCVDRLEPQVSAVAVNANDAVDTELPVLADAMAGNLGPLAGVLAGMGWALAQGGTHIVTVAVDTPFFPCDLVPHLIMAGEHHPDGFAIAATPDGDHGTFGLWPVTLRAALFEYLETGGRKVRGFTTAQHAGKAQFTDGRAFFNINTPADLAEAATWV